MIKTSRIVFLLVILMFGQDCRAQSAPLSLKESNKLSRIALKDILGNWYKADSTKLKISFVKENNSFVSIEGIKHGVGNYSFIIDKDSIFVNGTAINWPPYDCTLHLLDTNHLKIEFYQFFSAGATGLVFRRE